MAANRGRTAIAVDLRRSMNHTSGMTLQELGNQMGGMDYAAVRVGLRRFDSRLKQDRKMRRAFKNIVEMLNV